MNAPHGPGPGHLPRLDPAMAAGELAPCRILLVDDEEVNIRSLRSLLIRAGYRNVRSITDPLEVPSLFHEWRPDLMVLDLHMPFLSGFEVMAAVSEHVPSGDYVPILVLTGDKDPDARRRALSAGARDFVTKPYEMSEVLLRIRNLLETRILHHRIRQHAHELEDRVRERTGRLEKARIELLHRLALAAEFRDDQTGRHAERVGVLSAAVARRLGIADEVVEDIRRAAPLHDIGKIGIPDAILMKPGPLSKAEFEVMKEHTTIGSRILEGSDFPVLELAREIALHHHERWDGGGYQGRRGDETPLVGRIVTVVDAFDCLTHDRPYRQAVDLAEAIERIRRDRGAHFDPEVVDAFLAVVLDEDPPDVE